MNRKESKAWKEVLRGVNRWEDSIKDWAGLGFFESVRGVEDRVGWRRIVGTSSVIPQRLSMLMD